MQNRIPFRTVVTNVLVIGAGAAGLRAAIAAHAAGVEVIVIGKRGRKDAHTVLAAGGINAALGTVDPQDSWQQHFADTWREGYYLSDPAMVALLGRRLEQETPDEPRNWVLEELDAATAMRLDPRLCMGVVSIAGGSSGHGMLAAQALTFSASQSMAACVPPRLCGIASAPSAVQNTPQVIPNDLLGTTLLSRPENAGPMNAWARPNVPKQMTTTAGA